MGPLSSEGGGSIFIKLAKVMKSLIIGLSLLCCLPLGGQSLREGFQNPPAESRPRVWWHWMNGNVTRDGIQKDLLWMKAAGIGGFMVFDAGMATPQVVSERLEYMTPKWKEALSYALHLADSLDLEVTIPSSPGWSLMGGPWVQPRQAMKKLTWRTLDVSGNAETQSLQLPAPFTTTGPFQNKPIEPNVLLGEVIPEDLPSYYEDIKVLAMPLSSYSLSDLKAACMIGGVSAPFSKALTDGDLQTGVTLPFDDATGLATMDVTFDTKVTVSSLSLCDGRVRAEFDAIPAGAPCRLFVAGEDGSWTKVADIPSGGAPLQTLSFAPVSGRSFRLEVDRPQPDYTAMMMGYPVVPAKDITINEFNLYTTARVNHSEEKAGFMATHDIALFPTVAAEGINPRSVIDLTSKLTPDGRLAWKVPEGRWRIIRLGWSLTGRRNHPASPEATGLEVDKLDPEAFRSYFEQYLSMYDLPGSEAIKYILTDSYESGASTWTPCILSEFKARRGYDLTPWLPVLTGEVIESGEASDRFLYDWRKTISELIAENYDQLTDIARAHGLKGRYTESHEHGRLYVADGMQVKRSAAIPMSAIWASGADLQPCDNVMAAADLRESSSVAHLYGQNIVAAESFTVVGFPNNAWTFSPESLKPYADYAFANGLNRVVVHTSPHQPIDLKPGLSLTAVGQWFDRHETWADEARVWTDYLARTSYMLSQGRQCSDILYYYGEDNNISALFGHNPPSIPAGYDFDYVNADALLNLLQVSPDGRLTTPSGQSYRVLVLDANAARMSLPVLRRLAAFAEKGVLICGTAPASPLSMKDNGKEYSRLLSRLRSKAYFSEDLSKVLSDNALFPDVLFSGSLPQGPAAPRYVHRSLGEKQIYWISNPANAEVYLKASLRVSGLRPMSYDPETGDVSPVTYMVSDGRTEVSLDMAPHGAVFIVFEEPETETSFTLPRLSETPLEVEFTPWKVSFEAGRGAPESIVIDTLKSLTEMEDSGVKYFSGKAVYRSSFTLGKTDGGIVINLGDIKNIASLEINGQTVATLWKAPFKADITSYVHEGQNDIEVTVVNLWRNRLIGDVSGVGEPVTFTTLPFYTPDAPLFPSGLIGPVKIYKK